MKKNILNIDPILEYILPYTLDCIDTLETVIAEKLQIPFFQKLKPITFKKGDNIGEFWSQVKLTKPMKSRFVHYSQMNYIKWLD